MKPLLLSAMLAFAVTRLAAGDGVPVTAARAERRDVPIYLTGIGRIQPANRVLIRPQVDGSIVRIEPHEGDSVRAGALLVQIDPRPYQAALAQAEAKRGQDEAQLTYLRRTLERDAALAGKGLLDRQSYELQQATAAQQAALVKADAAAVNDAEIKLGYTRIVSPIDGRVGLRLIDAGNVVHAADAAGLMVVDQIRPIAVVFALPESALGSLHAALRAGAPGDLRVAALDPRTGEVLADGRLLAVDDEIGTDTGTLSLKGVFPNSELRLWPGEFVKARLQVAVRHGQVVVPRRAVQTGPDGEFVYLVSPQHEAVLRRVHTEDSGGDETIVTDGLAAGEWLVTDGTYLIEPGSRLALKAR